MHEVVTANGLTLDESPPVLESGDDSDIEGTGLRSLEAGEEVSFELGPGKDGRPKHVFQVADDDRHPGEHVRPLRRVH